MTPLGVGNLPWYIVDMCEIHSGKKKNRNLSGNDGFPVLTLISVACAATLVQDRAQVVNYFSACLGEACLFLIIKSISTMQSLLLN